MNINRYYTLSLTATQYANLFELYVAEDDPDTDIFDQFVYRYTNCYHFVNSSHQNSVLIFDNEKDKILCMLKI